MEVYIEVQVSLAPIVETSKGSVPEILQVARKLEQVSSLDQSKRDFQAAVNAYAVAILLLVVTNRVRTMM
jgi:hypothetical protein